MTNYYSYDQFGQIRSDIIRYSIQDRISNSVGVVEKLSGTRAHKRGTYMLELTSVISEVTVAKTRSSL